MCIYINCIYAHSIIIHACTRYTTVTVYVDILRQSVPNYVKLIIPPKKNG
jgi:hypothetical protein